MTRVLISRIEIGKEICYVRPATETTKLESCSTPFVYSARVGKFHSALARIMPRICDDCFLDKKHWCDYGQIKWIKIVHGEMHQYGFSAAISLARDEGDEKPINIVVPEISPPLVDAITQLALKDLVQEALWYLAGRGQANQGDLFAGNYPIEEEEELVERKTAEPLKAQRSRKKSAQ